MVSRLRHSEHAAGGHDAGAVAGTRGVLPLPIRCLSGPDPAVGTRGVAVGRARSPGPATAVNRLVRCGGGAVVMSGMGHGSRDLVVRLRAWPGQKPAAPLDPC